MYEGKFFGRLSNVYSFPFNRILSFSSKTLCTASSVEKVIIKYFSFFNICRGAVGWKVQNAALISEYVK